MEVPALLKSLQPGDVAAGVIGAAGGGSIEIATALFGVILGGNAVVTCAAGGVAIKYLGEDWYLRRQVRERARSMRNHVLPHSGLGDQTQMIFNNRLDSVIQIAETKAVGGRKAAEFIIRLSTITRRR